MRKSHRILFLIPTFFLFYTFIYPQDYPQRIISLGPAITEELYLLGVGDKIIANTIYCKNPQEARRKEKIGTVIKLNLERIILLKPDLVLATKLTDRLQLQKMRSLKINAIEIPNAKNFQDICKNFLQLGKLVGKKNEAQSLINKVKIKVDSIREKAKHLPKPKVILQIGARPLFIATQEYFINDFIEFAGGINIVKTAKTGLYSREEVLRLNPDVIIIATMGIVGEEEKGTWQKYRSINAVKNNRIYIIDSYRLCSPTPLSFVNTLEEIVDILHSKKEVDNFAQEIL